MSKEKYLQIKKEYRIRLALVIVLFILFAILDCILIYSSSRFIPLLATAMGSVVPLNHFLLVPFWQQKKAIEEQHPEWKELSPKGVRVPALEANKRTLAGIGVALVLLFSFAMFYKPVEQRQEINFKELNDISKLNSELSTSSRVSTSSESDSSSSTGESSQTERSNKEINNSYYHIPGTDDDEVRELVEKSVKELKEEQSQEQPAE
ncbi:hypothetical protein [Streptococcus sinensis]|uniref:hypothetical protein n=1 Tax=Streptococcus sinensis TaxID=176090 RepID=UPI00272B7A05|nr:hypothetical protein [Streptococcus sinensis]